MTENLASTGDGLRVLVTTNAAIGHFLPMVPTIQTLMAAGHEVVVGCPSPFADVVRSAGLMPMSCQEISVRLPAPPASDDPEVRLRWAITESWPADCRTWIGSLMEHARSWRPDLIVVEPVEHAGRIVAAALGVPYAIHGWGFTLPAGVHDAAAATLNDLYARYATAYAPPAVTTDLGSIGVQAQDAESVERYRYRPYSLPAPPLPVRGGRTSVLVTLGTYPNPRAASVLRAIAIAVRATGADPLVVLARRADVPAEGFPEGTELFDWVDMPQAIAATDLVVHHGGAGTTWAALSAGRPAVIVPQAGDQYRNAALVSTAGAAVRVDGSDISALTEAIARGLHTPSFAARAADIAADNVSLPDTPKLAADIVAIVQDHA